MPVSIRGFKQEDFDTLWNIDQQCFDTQLAYTRTELAVYMRRPGSFTLVAELAEDETGGADLAAGAGSPQKIVGFIVAEVRRNTGHIITLDVIAEARRAGIGSTLMQAAELKLRAGKAKVVALETPVNNLTAIRFYKHEGYFVEKTVAGYYSGQLDALLMVKDLKPATV